MPERLKAVTFDMNGTLMLGGTHGPLVSRPETREGMQELQDKGIRTGIITLNSLEVTRYLLHSIGIEDIIDPDDIVGRDSVRMVERTSFVRQKSTTRLGRLLQIEKRVEVAREFPEAIPLRPAPDSIHHLLGRWGVAQGEAMHVGDSPEDRRAANQANVAFLDPAPFEFSDSFLDLSQSLEVVWQLSKSADS